MSGKSAKLNRPFSKKVLSIAKKVVDKYEIILTFSDGEWYGKVLEMPMVFGDGLTPDKCVKNTKEALSATIAHLLERGDVIPVPNCEGKRNKQVNVRLTDEEKAILSAAASSQGYKGLGDFLRARALTPRSA